MGMQLNNIINIIIFLCLLVSCKQKAQDKILIKQDIERKQLQIDFFDQKYNNETFSMLIDESTISEHPILSYLNCEDEGYFSIHFVPKSDSLMQFWKKGFFKNYDFNNFDLEKDNEYIRKKLKSHFNNYNIFSYQIEKKYLDSNNGCTIESVFLKNESSAKIYLYDEESKKWEFLKTIKSKILPPYVDNNYFIQNFPQLFRSNKEYILPKNYFKLDSTQINLEKDKYEILILENNKKKDQKNFQHNSNPIEILRKTEKGYIEKAKNNKLIFAYNDNCPADGFQRIVSKNNYFTIEQTYCKDFLFVQSYTTFKINVDGSILLHKYGEEYTDRSNPDKNIKSIVKTSNDFGVIKFENITQEFLLQLIK
ncbi:hypothetical protein GCM10023210_03490 [Chryseobacterium ginsengisoli]|uniref:Lipoprotein n=1 Tax=Chryseobacterium ginsengisoli TaxID=363853 RepID=A0ABP9LUP1_9FLAO